MSRWAWAIRTAPRAVPASNSGYEPVSKKLRIRAARAGVIGRLIGQHIIAASRSGPPRAGPAARRRSGLRRVASCWRRSGRLAKATARAASSVCNGAGRGQRRELIAGGQRSGLHGGIRVDAESVFERRRGNLHLVLILKQRHLGVGKVGLRLIHVFGGDGSRRQSAPGSRPRPADSARPGPARL